jgi:hypothetical protein
MAFLRSAPTNRQTKRAWQRTVIEYAALMGWSHWHDMLPAAQVQRNCPNCRGAANLPVMLDGWPNLWLARPPRLIVVELKGERGRLTDSQRTWLELFRRCPGIEVYVWRPSSWHEIEFALR